MSVSVPGVNHASFPVPMDRLRRLVDRPRFRPDIYRDAMLVIGLVLGVAYAVGGFAKPVDAVVYWRAGTSTTLYPESWSECCEGHLFYPPPFAQLMSLLQPLGWQVFVVLLTVAIFASIWYCARGWSLPLLAVGIPYYFGFGPGMPATFLSYAFLGNIHWILVALTIVALERPAAYAPLAITKMTIAIGWLWPVMRRDWRSALIGAGATAMLVAISFMASPKLWFEFAGFIARNAGMSNPPLPLFPVPFPVRFAFAIGLLAWGARGNRRWVVPIAAGLSVPALWGFGFLPFVVGGLRVAYISRSPGRP